MLAVVFLLGMIQNGFDVTGVILLVVCVALVINYLWKLSLMKAEKQLIEEGKKVSA